MYLPPFGVTWLDRSGRDVLGRGGTAVAAGYVRGTWMVSSDRKPPSGGFIMLYRRLDHPLMSQLPAAWFRVFIAILLRVNWQAGTWWDGTKEVVVPPGSMVTSLERLSKIAGTRRQQTRGALKYLQASRIVAQQTTHHYTVLTVVNWETYQSLAESDNTPRDSGDNTAPTQQQHAESARAETNRTINKNKETREQVLDRRPMMPDQRSPTTDASREKLESAELLRTELAAFKGSAVPQYVVRGVLRELAAYKVSVAEFCFHLRTLGEDYRPGRSKGPRYPPGEKWFAAAVRELSNFCGHHEPKGDCVTCDRCEEHNCPDTDSQPCVKCEEEAEVEHAKWKAREAAKRGAS